MKKITKQKRNFILLSATVLLTFGLTAWSGLADDTMGPSDNNITSTASNLADGTSEGFSEIMAPSPLAITTGNFGTALWSFDSDTGTVTFYPDPANPTVLNKFPDDPSDYFTGSPWVAGPISRSQVKKVVFDDGLVSGTSFSKFFQNLTALTTVEGLEKVDTSALTDMSHMFEGTRALADLDFTGFNTSNVTTMEAMFYSAYLPAEVDVSPLNNNPSLITVKEMFYYASFPLGINFNGFDTSTVENMDGFLGTMLPSFYDVAPLTLDVSSLDTQNVKTMANMFRSRQFVEHIILFDQSAYNSVPLTDINSMFSGCQSLIDIVNLNQLNTTNVTNMSSTFANVSLYTMDVFDISQWDTSNVTNMSAMFYYPSWWGSDTSELKRRILDISNFDTSTVTNMSYMFAGGDFWTEIRWFDSFTTSNVTNMSGMFSRCDGLHSLDLSNFNTSNVTDMSYMFDTMSLTNEKALINFDTSKVTNMSYMFSSTFFNTFDEEGNWIDPSTLPPKTLDLSNFDTSNVTSMSNMFSSLGSGVSSVNLSSFDTSNVNNMSSMFSQTYYLQSLNLSNFDMSSVTSTTGMFNLNALVQLELGEDFAFPTNSDFTTIATYQRPIYYSEEWKFVPTNTILYNDNTEFMTGYNSSRVAGTYIRMGVEYTVELKGNQGILPDGNDVKIISTRYKVSDLDGIDPIVLNNPFERKGYQIVSWSENIDGTGISYLEGTSLKNLTDQAGTVISLYAQWEPAPFVVTFHVNGASGGDFTETVRYLSLIPQPNSLIYGGYVFDGWYTDTDTTQLWDFTSDTMTPEDMNLYAKWVSIADLIHITNTNVVIYKNESTAEEVENAVGITIDSYTDYQGTVHAFTGMLEWDPAWISEGGVNEMKVYVLDPSTGEKIYGLEESYLYVLNRPYIDGPSEMWIFEGETLNPGIYSAIGYGEVPDFENKRINRERIDLTFDASAVNIWDVGTYWASYSGKFEDYMLKASTFSFPVAVHVQKRAGLTKEEKQQVNSSDFWVNVTEIYHTMKAGQIVDVNPSNYMDGGSVRTETVADGLGYDRQLNVQVGEYIYMSPDIVNVLQEEKTGQMNVYLNGRSWIFNSDTTDAVGNDYPKGYYDLRMDVTKKEAITALVGADTPQMQLGFSMNRTWFGTPTFVITPNESIKSSVAGGATPYLFHYNESTNELELVGSMTVQSNGSLSIPMNGVYKDYVILTSLPQNGNYRITEHTNALDSKTYEAVANNIIDSGHALPNGNGLNGISTTKYARITEDAILSEKNETTQKTGLIVGLSALGIALVGGGYVFWKKKKGLDD